MKVSAIIFSVALLAQSLYGGVYSSNTQSTSNSSQQAQSQTVPEITPSIGPLRGNTVDIVLDAEFLWWYASVTSMPYAALFDVASDGDLTNPQRRAIRIREIYEFDWNWDPGLRVGLGVVTNHYGWDVYADWTYYYTSVTDSKKLPPLTEHTLNNNPFGTEGLVTPWSKWGQADLYSQIKAKAQILFNQIDLSLGRNFWINPSMKLRPYTGIRGMWSRLNLIAQNLFLSTTAASPFDYDSAYDRFRQKMWGVGLLAGIQTSWQLSKNWSFFTDTGISLLYSKFNIYRNIKEFATLAGVQTRLHDYTTRHDDIYSLQVIFDLALGLRWEWIFGNESYRLMFDAGWESHFLPSFNQLDQYNADAGFTTPPVFKSSNGDLSLSGLVVRGRFDF